MNHPSERPGFFEGVLVALAASLLGGLAYAVLDGFLSPSALPRLVIAGLGCGYVLYLLSRAARRIGRFVVAAAWSLVAAAAWFGAPSLGLYAGIHLGMVWLVRSLYFHAGPLAALADLGLHLLSWAAALWALERTGSLFLALWCLLLVQALFVFIPPRSAAARRAPLSGIGRDRFERARRAADQVLAEHRPQSFTSE